MTSGEAGESADSGGRPSIDPTMARHYASGAELGRLENVNPLEFERTKLMLAEALPPTGRVIDVGGGPGAYASWLAERGYEVDLVDPISLHVQQADALGEHGRRFRTQLGDARALPFPDAAADAVVMMGPMFHLTEPADRQRALAETFRVLRPGGTAVVTAMGRYFLMFKEVVSNSIRDQAVLERILAITASGLRQSPDGPFPAYSHRPEDLEREVAGAGFVDVRLHAIEGFFNLLGDLRYRLADPDSRAALFEVLQARQDDPIMTGLSGHLMATARRPEAEA
jgi:ubiquinone/menaquinone biosynthesis C-methylase UbiE